MQPFYIDLNIGKFQQCCYPDCNGTVVHQVVAKNIYLGACAIPGHREYIQTIGHQLNLSTEITKLEVHIKNVFIQPEGYTQKCKYAQWVRSLVNQDDEIPIPQPKAQAQRRRLSPQLKTHKLPKPFERPDTTVVENWSWVSNYGKWMNINGQIVKLSQLAVEELIDTIQAVVKTNFTRVTKRVQWTKQLIPDFAHYEYPEEELYVGYEEAGNKLEEFKEEAQSRGLIP